MLTDEHLYTLAQRSCERVSLGCCRRNRHILIIIGVYSELWVSVRRQHHSNRPIIRQLAADSDDDDDVPIPPTTTKAEAFASTSIVQENLNYQP